VELYDDRAESASRASTIITGKRLNEYFSKPDTFLECLDGRDLIQFAGVHNKYIRNNGSKLSGNIRHEPSCNGTIQRYGLLLASERDQCERYERMVRRVELYDDYEFAWATHSDCTRE
jgi:hypothetical protein